LPPTSGKFFYSDYLEQDNIYYISIGVYQKDSKQNLILSAQEEKLGIMSEACYESKDIREG